MRNSCLIALERHAREEWSLMVSVPLLMIRRLNIGVSSGV